MEARKVIGIDTNVLVRLIMRDDEAQFQAVYSLMKRIESENKQGYINLVVLTEFSFLLLRTYKIPKEVFINILFSLCQKTYLLLEQESAVLKSIEAYKKLNIDFHDVLISYLNQHKKVESTMTFDKKAASRVFGFELL